MNKISKYMKNTIIVMSLILILASSCINVPDNISIPSQWKNIGIPIIKTFEATPSIINNGDITNLHWNTSNAQSVHIDNGIGDVAIAGSFPISPSTTTSYTLTARNAMGITTARTQIIVKTTQSSQPTIRTTSAPSIILFDSDRLIIFNGEAVLLRWNVLEASQVTLNPIGTVDSSGEIRIYPNKTTTYVLTAINPAGNSTASVNITVLYSSPQLSTTETSLVVNAIPEESGSLIKGTQYLDYLKQESACVGDTAGNLASRAFLSFDISSIPVNAIIEEAVLDLSQYVKYGDPSYVRSAWGNMGAMEVYHIQYGKYDELGITAYNQVAKLTQNGSFTKYPLSLWAWDAKNAIDGSPVVQKLVQSSAMRCQFRIQFYTSTNWDSISDMFCFDNAKLTIKYTLP